MLHPYRVIYRFLLPAALVILGGVFLFRLAFWRPEASQKPAWTRNELATIRAALTRYEARTRRLPTTAEGLEALAGAATQDLWSPRELDYVPRDAWGREFHYECPPAGAAARDHDYEITSAGADGRLGTRDDIRARGRRAGKGLTIDENSLGLDWIMGLMIIASGLLVIRGLRAERRPHERGRTLRGSAA